MQRTLAAGFIARHVSQPKPTKAAVRQARRIMRRRNLMSIKYHFRNTRLQIVE
jgi:hypothetical protein